LGFKLKEVKELLCLRLDPTTSCAGVKGRAEEKIADIEAKIATLQRMRKALVKLTKECSGRGPTSECPILDARAVATAMRNPALGSFNDLGSVEKGKLADLVLLDANPLLLMPRGRDGSPTTAKPSRRHFL
jgi:cytosine/adenosine deaminase-related metal-dependent hydrolase